MRSRWWRRVDPRAGLLWLLLPLAASCVYYNTFFLAKKSFHAAERSVAESKTDKLPSDAERNYDLTLQQCRKVLASHHKSKWADDALYLMGASYYGKGDYDSALVRLAQIPEMFPKSEFRDDALFLTAMAKNKKREHDEAKQLFEKVIADYPKFEKRDEILFTLAESAASQRKREEAIRGYEELVREYPKSARAEDALDRIGEIYFEAGRFDSASIFFDRLLRRTRDEDTRIEAAVRQAETLTRLGKAAEALALLDQVEPDDPSESRSGAITNTGDIVDQIVRVRLQRAAALNSLDRPLDALETLRGVTTRYPASNLAVEAQFQIGYTYEAQLDSLEAARREYDAASLMIGQSIFKEQAAQRSTSLKSLIEMQQRATEGDAAEEARAEAALRVAEILLLDRNMVDDAVAQYQKVEQEFPDTRAAPRAAYALAYIKWKKQADSLGAQQEFRDLVARYPASTQARGAIELLAGQGADTSGLFSLLQEIVPDSAAMAESLAAAMPDSMAALGDSGAVVATAIDSLAPRDSLRTLFPRDSIRAVSRRDSLRAVPAPDSLGGLSLPDSMPADSVHHAPRPRRGVQGEGVAPPGPEPPVPGPEEVVGPPADPAEPAERIVPDGAPPPVPPAPADRGPKQP